MDLLKQIHYNGQPCFCSLSKYNALYKYNAKYSILNPNILIKLTNSKHNIK